MRAIEAMLSKGFKIALGGAQILGFSNTITKASNHGYSVMTKVAFDALVELPETDDGAINIWE
jgi:hypothetical protein